MYSESSLQIQGYDLNPLQCEFVKNYVAVFYAGEGMHNQEQQC
jgi:hypothetical protein